MARPNKQPDEVLVGATTFIPKLHLAVAEAIASERRWSKSQALAFIIEEGVKSLQSNKGERPSDSKSMSALIAA